MRIRLAVDRDIDRPGLDEPLYNCCIFSIELLHRLDIVS